MDRLREEVEKAKQLQSQKETLEQKLEVKAFNFKHISVYKQLQVFVTCHSTFVSTHNLGYRCKEQGPGGAVS